MSDPGPTPDPQPAEPPPAPTVTDLINQIQLLDSTRTALRQAHADTVAAASNVSTVTFNEQALIDAATAHFDQATNAAKADQTAKQAAEVTASDAENSAFNDLETLLAAFKADAG